MSQETKDDVPDYMSDDFLKQLEEAAKKEEPRYGPKKKRKAPEVVQTPMKLTEKMAKTREEGLSTPVSKSNIGHKLLEKMGYKEGMGLGRKESGISTPVDINLKAGRSGLGRESQIKSKKKELLDSRLSHEKTNQHRFRTHQKSHLGERKARSDLKKAQHICESLDTQAGIGAHSLWPPKLKSEPVEEETLEPGQYRPFTEEEQEARTHKLVRVTDDEIEAPSHSLEDDPAPITTVLYDLGEVITYLREKHFYCYYCAIRFDNKDDMDKNCPGPNEQDHES